MKQKKIKKAIVQNKEQINNKLKEEDPNKIKLLANPKIYYQYQRLFNRLCNSCRVKVIQNPKIDYNSLSSCDACRPKIKEAEEIVNKLIGGSQ